MLDKSCAAFTAPGKASEPAANLSTSDFSSLNCVVRPAARV